MNFAMIFKVAVLAILRNKTRALLTCLGIIVGIAAVIAVLAIGKGASTMMVKEISAMGNNLVMVTHEDDIAAYATRHIVMRDGRVMVDDKADGGVRKTTEQVSRLVQEALK